MAEIKARNRPGGTAAGTWRFSTASWRVGPRLRNPWQSCCAGFPYIVALRFQAHPYHPLISTHKRAISSLAASFVEAYFQPPASQAHTERFARAGACFSMIPHRIV